MFKKWWIFINFIIIFNYYLFLIFIFYNSGWHGFASEMIIAKIIKYNFLLFVIIFVIILLYITYEMH